VKCADIGWYTQNGKITYVHFDERVFLTMILLLFYKIIRKQWTEFLCEQQRHTQKINPLTPTVAIWVQL